MHLLNKKLLVLTFASTLILTACRTNEATSQDASESTTETSANESAEAAFPLATTNEEEAIDGGVLNYALVTDTPFQGIMSPEFKANAYDAQLLSFNMEPMFSIDESFRLSNDGYATYEFDEANNQVTIRLTEELNWSDGEPITSEDLVFPYAVLGHPDYPGTNFGEAYLNIAGMEAYNKGEAETISGITVVDDLTIEIEYLKTTPSLLQSGGGIWEYPMPKHHLEGIEVADMPSAPEIRENPVGTGPFKVESIVPGESVHYVVNEHYWKGEPGVAEVVAETVPTSTISIAMENGEYDIASMPAGEYDAYKDLENIALLGQPDTQYSYLGFKMGKWNEEEGINVLDPDAKLADKELRQAIAYAIDNDAVGEQFYNGLQMRATSPIAPAYEEYHNAELTGYSYNPEKAMELLDEAGYVDTNDDGFRETPVGEELVINYAGMSGSEEAEPITDYYIQQWEAVGLNVDLVDGRLMEFQDFYNRVHVDDEAIDMYKGAWSTGSDPNPSGLYGPREIYNYPRWATEENTQLLDNISSQEAFDHEYQINAYHEWQAYFMEEVPALPLLNPTELIAVNNRVKNYDITRGNPNGWEVVELTAVEPAQ
ncbi:oligopeptide ABC transporter substrate-binding protein [Desemzia sp. FAM 23991]|uniref:oligopeptide ABC transporter substrate-binding protein n=1 Tax=unclassified Desemzia TaxID=2685243 RepID=UPI003886A57F